ncbi:MAG: epimerase [Nocardioides sp.]|nr:epimerase [Nocardioides sp.]
MVGTGEKHVVVGAGPVGLETARELVRRGVHDVLLVSRSGAGVAVDGVRRVALDASDADALTSVAEGAAAIHNAVNPPSYDVWPTWWPPVAEALLTAAERAGAVLVTCGNLYPYGERPDAERPMVEGDPDTATGTKGRLRAGMWAEARRRHEQGRIRAVEVRGSDYMGPGIRSGNGHVSLVAPRALAGKPVRMIGRVDQPHSFADVRDVARTMVEVAGRPGTHGRVWHVPTNPAVTQAQAVADVCRSVGREPVRVRAYPGWLVPGLLGTVVPVLRELRETAYQFRRPYLLDSSAARTELGLEPTPWEEVCRATAATALGEDAVASTEGATGARQ